MTLAGALLQWQTPNALQCVTLPTCRKCDIQHQPGQPWWHCPDCQGQVGSTSPHKQLPTRETRWWYLCQLVMSSHCEVVDARKWWMRGCVSILERWFMGQATPLHWHHAAESAADLSLACSRRMRLFCHSCKPCGLQAQLVKL